MVIMDRLDLTDTIVFSSHQNFNGFVDLHGSLQQWRIQNITGGGKFFSIFSHFSLSFLLPLPFHL